MTEEEAVDAALKTAVQDDDGAVDEKTLIDEVAALLEFDEAAERHNKAKRAMARRRKPGSTAPEGQLTIPGLEPYSYEPARLVADNEGHVIEQVRAPLKYKQAEAERARLNARRQTETASRKTKESETFATWIIDGLKSGRDIKDLRFGVFVHDTGTWSAGIPENGGAA